MSETKMYLTGQQHDMTFGFRSQIVYKCFFFFVAILNCILQHIITISKTNHKAIRVWRLVRKRITR